MSIERDLMTVRQAADWLQVAERTVREMIDRGDIPAAKIGKAYRIERVDLENFIASRKEKTDG